MDTESLSLIAVFVRVARCMSFSGAAAELHVSTGTVSRQIARLEKKMGVQLLERSTRKVGLTEIGKTFYESSRHILLLAEEAMSQVQDLQAEPSGTLRLTAPLLFSVKHLGPLISRFTERYPHVEVQLKVSDQLESLPLGDFDIAAVGTFGGVPPAAATATTATKVMATWSGRARGSLRQLGL